MTSHRQTTAMSYEDRVRDHLVAISHPEQSYSITQ